MSVKAKSSPLHKMVGGCRDLQLRRDGDNTANREDPTRPYVQVAMEELGETLDFTVTSHPTTHDNDATKIPDFSLRHRETNGLLALVELKHPSRSNDPHKWAATTQGERYLGSYDVLIWTNICQWALFVSGTLVDEVTVCHFRGGSFTDPLEGAEGELQHLFRDAGCSFLESPVDEKSLREQLAHLTKKTRDFIQEAIRSLYQKQSAKPKTFSLGNSNQVHPLQISMKSFLSRIAWADQYNRDQETVLFADQLAQMLALGALIKAQNGGDIPPQLALLKATLQELESAIYSSDTPAKDRDILLRWSWPFEKLCARIPEEVRGQPISMEFYQYFLQDYHKKQAKRLGVVYTPLEVARFAVYKVKEHLHSYGLKLSSPKVRFMEPSCGSGTFVLALEEEIRKELLEEGGQRAWEEYIRNQLSGSPENCKYVAYDKMPAPAIMAQYNLLRFYQKYGVEPEKLVPVIMKDSLSRVLSENELKALAESLGDNPSFPDREHLWQERLHHQAHHQPADRITIFFGNPPWGKGQTPRARASLGQLVDKKRGSTPGGKHASSRNLYLPFLLAPTEREKGHVIFSFILPNSLLSSQPLSGIRQYLLEYYPYLSITDLHGDQKNRTRDQTPNELSSLGRDAKIFTNVPLGTCSMLGSTLPSTGKPEVSYQGIWGSLQVKLLLMNLLADTGVRQALQGNPYFDRMREVTLQPVKETGHILLPMGGSVDMRVPYQETFWGLSPSAKYGSHEKECCPRNFPGLSTGMKALRANTLEILQNQLCFLANHTWEECILHWTGGDGGSGPGGDKTRERWRKAVGEIQGMPLTEALSRIRPFQFGYGMQKWYYHPKDFGMFEIPPPKEGWENVYLVLKDRLEGTNLFAFLTKLPPGKHYLDSSKQAHCIPVRVPTLGPLTRLRQGPSRFNLNPKYAESLARALGMDWEWNSSFRLQELGSTLYPIDVFLIWIGLFRDPTYEELCAPQLQTGFPKVPPFGPQHQEYLRFLHHQGLHQTRVEWDRENLPDHPYIGDPIVDWSRSYSLHKGRLYLNGRTEDKDYITGISEEVWGSRHGGDGQIPPLSGILQNHRGQKVEHLSLREINAIRHLVHCTRSYLKFQKRYLDPRQREKAQMALKSFL